MPKKILGIVFLAISILLALAVAFLANSLVGAITGFITAVSNKDADAIGFSMGLLIYWIAHITAMIVLWRLGMRWFRSKPIGK